MQNEIRFMHILFIITLTIFTISLFPYSITTTVTFNPVLFFEICTANYCDLFENFGWYLLDLSCILFVDIGMCLFIFISTSSHVSVFIPFLIFSLRVKCWTMLSTVDSLFCSSHHSNSSIISYVYRQSGSGRLYIFIKHQMILLHRINMPT